jgi:hypothetical protein
MWGNRAASFSVRVLAVQFFRWWKRGSALSIGPTWDLASSFGDVERPGFMRSRIAKSAGLAGT